jgi:predicted site-specific integrase-resolvase
MTSKNGGDDLLNATGVARLLDIGSYGVLALARRGRLPCVKDSGGRRLYRRRDVEQLMAERNASKREETAVPKSASAV